MHAKERLEIAEQVELAGAVSDAIVESYRRHHDDAPINGTPLPSRERVAAICAGLLRIMFPGYFGQDGTGDGGIVNSPKAVAEMAGRLEEEVLRALRCHGGEGPSGEECRRMARETSWEALRRVPAVRELLAEDIQAAHDGDPAATSHREVILAYPCLVAISIYRLAHVLVEQGIPLLPRMMTEYAHSRTGIDIHPGARIGRRFFIDHGTGVVIGETTEIGDGVKLYQGVTLGARSFPKDESGRAVKGIKRHPRIEDDVTIYSGATILGGDVVIGRGSVIGGNVWLTHSVPPYTTVLVSVAQEIRLQRGIDDYRI